MIARHINAAIPDPLTQNASQTRYPAATPVLATPVAVVTLVVAVVAVVNAPGH